MIDGYTLEIFGQAKQADAESRAARARFVDSVPTAGERPTPDGAVRRVGGVLAVRIQRASLFGRLRWGTALAR